MALQTFTTGQVLTAAQVNALQANDYNQTVSTKTVSYVLVAADVGTRVVMNAAGATTITVNTGLFAAGDTLQILNIGAGVTTITAGSATVSTSSVLALSQYDAGTLYFTSTGVAIWMMVDAADTSAAAAGTLTGTTLASNVLASSLTSFGATPTLTTPKITTYTTAGDVVYGTGSSVISRLGIGTVGQVLTVNSGATAPEWATPAGGGGYTLLSTTTMAGTSTSTKVSGISQSYKHLFILLSGVYQATKGDMFYRYNNVSTSDFAGSLMGTIGTTQTNETSANVGYAYLMLQGATSAATTKLRLQSAIWIYNYTSTSPIYSTAQTLGSDNTVMRSAMSFATNNVSNPVTEFDLYADYNTTGTIRIYGVS